MSHDAGGGGSSTIAQVLGTAALAMIAAAILIVVWRGDGVELRGNASIDPLIESRGHAPPRGRPVDNVPSNWSR